MLWLRRASHRPGALSAVVYCALRVPEALAVVGYDDFSLSISNLHCQLCASFLMRWASVPLSRAQPVAGTTAYHPGDRKELQEEPMSYAPPSNSMIQAASIRNAKTLKKEEIR
ncbi:hypothetical protein [Dictyobacter halimunensis]|uniref:hypothetical protein n=1 Tax=Dictyobacter halimunensis TaxID=3026934 RepID=UPI0030C677B7